MNVPIFESMENPYHNSSLDLNKLRDLKKKEANLKAHQEELRKKDCKIERY